MASRNTTTSPNARQRVQRSNTDSIRWIVGLLLLCVGVFAAVALFSSFFCWEADQSILRKSSEEPELFRETVRTGAAAQGPGWASCWSTVRWASAASWCPSC